MKNSKKVKMEAPKRAEFKKRKLSTWLICVLIPAWAFCGYMLTQFVVAQIFTFVLSEKALAYSSTQSIYTIIADIVSLLVIIGIPYLISKTWRTSRKELGLLELPTWTDIALAPIGYFVYIIFSYLLFALFRIFPWFNPEQTQNVGYNFSMLYGSNRIFATIALVVVAPIVEEVIFRGFVYGKLKKNIRDSKKKIFQKESIAVIISTLVVSLVFAFAHGQWNVGVDVFAMSVVLCILREITGSIYPGILIHMLKNALAFFILSSTLGLM